MSFLNLILKNLQNIQRRSDPKFIIAMSCQAVVLFRGHYLIHRQRVIFRVMKICGYNTLEVFSILDQISIQSYLNVCV